MTVLGMGVGGGGSGSGIFQDRFYLLLFPTYLPIQLQLLTCLSTNQPYVPASLLSQLQLLLYV